MVRLGEREREREREIANEDFYAAKKYTKACNVNVDNPVISKLVKANSSKPLNAYLDKL